MWMTIFYSVASVSIAIAEAPKLWKERKKKELWIFAAIWAGGALLGITASQHVLLPNPLDGIAVVIGPFAQALYSMFD
ncbi:hypothetical protein ACFFNY_31735 [Paenibacillus hodogayensis]|uniref:Uncharacterized protein n=1 Tax=Paenibacillus hodogayensis TaxID=279208 RepID=A0ABV5W715_9BACL